MAPLESSVSDALNCGITYDCNWRH